MPLYGSADIQWAIDNYGMYRLESDTTYNLDAPIFIENGDLFGPGLLNSIGSTAIVVGLDRDRISSGHYTPQGYRTLGDSHLVVSGSVGDLGPLGKWSNITSSLVIELKVTTHESWTAQPRIPLAGIQARESGAYQPNPAPWLIYVENGKLRVAVRLQDSDTCIYESVGVLTSPDLDLYVRISLLLGTVTVDGILMTQVSGYPWPYNARLLNNHQWPLGIGWFRLSGGGYWGAEGPHHDFTLRSFAMNRDGDPNSYFRIWSNAPRPVSYVGAPSLPIVPTTNGLTLAIHKDQDIVTDSSREVTIENLKITGSHNGPAIWIGTMMGQGLISNVRVNGGPTRGVHCSGMGMVYRLMIRDLQTQPSVWDSSIYLHRAWGATIDGGSVNGARAGISLVLSDGSVRGSFVPPSTGQDALVYQQGGTFTITDVDGDFEVPTDTPAVLLAPDWGESPADDTICDVSGCSNGWDNTNALRFAPRPEGYTGKIHYSVRSR